MAGLLQVIFAAVSIVSIVPLSYNIPFVVIPGLGVICSVDFLIFVEFYETYSGSEGICIDVGDHPSHTLSIPLLKQTAVVCERIKKIHHLQNGYNLMGFSQGGLVARGVIEFCDGGPPVRNFISFGTPHAGISSLPALPHRCLQSLSMLTIYSKFMQKYIAPSGYVKLPSRMKAYMKGCTFLPKLNNEIIGKRNSTYKERFSSLKNLVLVMYEEDLQVIPKESAWFGFYEDGTSSVVPTNKTKLYIEDWIGLKKLDEEGKVHFVTMYGEHLQFSKRREVETIIPFLKD